MKKEMFVVTLIVMCLAIYGISFAADTKESKGSMMGKGAMQCDEMKSDVKLDESKTMYHGMMMKHMIQKEMVATEGGGVIILVGNKLIKYDRDLNLAKEVEIKIDSEATMKQMKEHCEMMKECGMDEE